MIAIYPIHRRLAEIHLQAQKFGGYAKLPYNVIVEFNQCIEANAKLVVRLIRKVARWSVPEPRNRYERRHGRW